MNRCITSRQFSFLTQLQLQMLKNAQMDAVSQIFVDFLPVLSCFNTTNLNLYHYAGNNPVKYVDPTGMWEVDPEDGTWIAQKGDTLWGKWGEDWQRRTGYKGDPTKLQVGEHVGPKRWTNSGKNGADINAFSNKWSASIGGEIEASGLPRLTNAYVTNSLIKLFFSFELRENSGSAFIVAGHGRDGTGYLVDRNGVGIKPTTLAEAIKAHPNYVNGQDILLLNCLGGANNINGESYAQLVANALGKGSLVWAFDDYVITEHDTFYNWIDIYAENDGELKCFVGR